MYEAAAFAVLVKHYNRTVIIPLLLFSLPLFLQLTWTAKCLGQSYGGLKFGEEHTVSYLPLSHIAAQTTDIYLPITYGGTVHFAQPDALKVSV